MNYTVTKKRALEIKVGDEINDIGIWETVTAVTVEDGFIAIETNLGITLPNRDAKIRVKVNR